jgi:UDP-N-acetylenolpyruvoylglucosamine reductase
MRTSADLLDCPVERSTQLAVELRRILSEATVVRADEPLARRTTLRVGGPADAFVEPANEADLSQVLDFCQRAGEKFFILGRGSNLLVRDGGFRGVVISLGHPHFSRIELAGDRIWCGAGARLKQVVMEARRSGLSGVEFLEGIPGSVGGALRMNAGAMGGAMFDAVESVRFMDHFGRVFEKRGREIPVVYRACALFKNHIALDALLRCTHAPLEEIDKRINAFSKKRWGSQPAAASAGCIFKNLQTIGAGQLIDELGLKGLRVGGAVVSPEHGNFIVNDGHATARDVLQLIELLKQHARDARGLELQTEVEIIGED